MRNNLTRKTVIWASTLAALCLLCPALRSKAASESVVEKWKDRTFGTGETEKHSLATFFSEMQDSFAALDAKDRLDQQSLETLTSYLELRDTWMESTSLENIVLAGTVTHAVNNALAKLVAMTLEGGENLVRNVDQLVALAKKSNVSKSTVFSSIDRAILKIDREHKPLTSFGRQALSSGRTEQWEKYVQQFGLQYIHEKDAVYLLPLGANPDIIWAKLKRPADISRAPKSDLAILYWAMVLDHSACVMILVDFTKQAKTPYEKKDITQFVDKQLAGINDDGSRWLFLDSTRSEGQSGFVMLPVIEAKQGTLIKYFLAP